mgnify:CR=1 FL=1
MSWNIIEMDVIRWSEARGIIPNSTSLAQWNKAKEELYELREALVERDRPGIIDGLGDILVCRITIFCRDMLQIISINLNNTLNGSRYR